MVRELFDILDREGLGDPDNIERQVGRYSLTEIIELDERLAGTITAQHSAALTSDLTGFDFWPNSDLTVLRGCHVPDCRIRRIENLVRFATMWADSVYIPSYFGITPPGRIEPLWREWLYGSVRALLMSRPAIEAGIIKIAPAKPTSCPVHDPGAHPEIKGLAETLFTAEQSMQKEYQDSIKVTFQARPGLGYGVWITGPDDVFPHGGVAHTTDPNHCDPPAWLPDGVRRRASAGDTVHYHVPKSRIEKSGIFSEVLHPIVEDVLNQHIECRLRHTKYLTHRPVDSVFLNSINENPNFSSWNAILSQYLEYEMPILNGVPVEELIDLRKHDYEAFQVYRDTMKEIINTHIANRPAITGTEAKDMYDDIVRPQLHKMNQKLRAAKDKLSTKLHRDVLIAGGVIALGLSTGIVAPAVTGLGAAALAGKSIWDQRHASDELKSDNLYFLWKVGQKSRRN